MFIILRLSLKYSACPDNKVHGANMGPTWVLSAPDGPHVGPMDLAIWVDSHCDGMTRHDMIIYHVYDYLSCIVLLVSLEVNLTSLYHYSYHTEAWNKMADILQTLFSDVLERKSFIFLAATKQLYEWYFLSVCPSVTPFWLCSHHRIIMKFSRVITLDQGKVHAKGQGQRSKVKVTEVTTQIFVSGL